MKMFEYGNKTLHVTISSKNITKSKDYNYGFKVKVDEIKKHVILLVFNKEQELVSDEVYWTYESIDKQIRKKLKYIAVVSAESKIKEAEKYYKYNNVDLLKDLTVEQLCEGIAMGDVKIDLRIGTYKSGKNKGKTHDHGTGFRVKFGDLKKYASIERII